MNFLARYSLLVIIFIGCIGYCFAQDNKPLRGEIVTARPSPEYDSKSWKEFSSKEGHFTVLLPDKPAENVHALDSEFGKLDVHTFTLKTFAYYGVAYADYPQANGIRDVNTFFNGYRVGVLKATNAQLLEEKDDYRFNYPGRFLKMQIPGGYINRARIYLIRNRFYVLSLAMPENDGDAETRKFHEEIAAKFFNSFKPKIDENGMKGDRFGDPVTAKPLGLPTGAGVNIDPAVNNLPYSRDGRPEPEAKINGGILNGKAISLPKPDYPADAKAEGASGEVKVKIVIDESGNVIWAKAVSGHQLLQAVSEEAASKAKFQPTTLKGEPVKLMGFLIYRFVSK